MSAAAVSTPVTEAGTQLEDDSRWLPVQALPCQLTADVAVPRFTVRDFLGLRAGLIVATEWRLERAIPLQVNGVLIGWGELEGAGVQLAVRITELR